MDVPFWSLLSHAALGLSARILAIVPIRLAAILKPLITATETLCLVLRVSTLQRRDVLAGRKWSTMCAARKKLSRAVQFAEDFSVVAFIIAKGFATAMTADLVMLYAVNLASFGMSMQLVVSARFADFQRSLPAIHPCTLPCHAPSTCVEAEPCRSVVNISCSCGRITQPMPCGRCTSSPNGREGSQQLKCTTECAIAKRNARLADALGISPDRQDSRSQVTYSEALITFARGDLSFCAMVEKSFAE